MVCENCGKEHDGTFGSGRFCCRSCANSRHFSKEVKEKISKGVIKYNNENKLTYTYICEKCNKGFQTTKTFKKNNHIYCDDCKRTVKHVKTDITSILDVSKRTITKILNRSNVGCSLCGWNESTCDIHHIIPKSKGGNNELDNLIIICPNCHRVIHNTDKYSVDLLKTKSIDKIFSNWKKFYHPCN